MFKFLILLFLSSPLFAESVCKLQFIEVKEEKTLEEVYQKNCKDYTSKDMSNAIFINSLNPKNLIAGSHIKLIADKFEKKADKEEKNNTKVKTGFWNSEVASKYIIPFFNGANLVFQIIFYVFMLGLLFFIGRIIYGVFKTVKEFYQKLFKKKPIKQTKKVLTKVKKERAEEKTSNINEDKIPVVIEEVKVPYVYPSKEELLLSMKKEIVGHESAITSLVNEVKIHSVNNNSRGKPLLILLPGPTGVGKTEIGKALSKSLDVKLYRVGMDSYTKKEDIWSLLGSATGYVGSAEGGALPNMIREANKNNKPFVLLLDEVEKAAKEIWQSLLIFFDEGILTDSLGTVRAPKDSIIIMTSNMALDFKKSEDEVREEIRHRRFFSPEFLGRIELIAPLTYLKPEERKILTKRLLLAFSKDMGLEIINVTDELITALESYLENSFTHEGVRGARNKLKKAFQNEIITIKEKNISKVKINLYDNNFTMIGVEK